MTETQAPPDDDGLRSRAETRLAQTTAPTTVGEGDTLRLVHELQVHQIELEMQNEELRLARAEAQSVLSRYTDLYDSAPLGYLSLDRNFHIRQINLAGAELLGQERIRLVGRNLLDFIDPESRPSLGRLLEKTFVSHGRETCDMALLATEIASHHAFAHVEMQVDETGQSLRVMLIDITEQKRAEQQVIKLSQAIEQSPASIAITNLDAVIEYVNESFIRTTGYSREELIGQNPRFLHSGNTPVENYKALWEALESGETWTGEFHNRHKNGKEYIELAVVTPIRQSDGRITHYAAVKEDITEKHAWPKNWTAIVTPWSNWSLNVPPNLSRPTNNCSPPRQPWSKPKRRPKAQTWQRAPSSPICPMKFAPL